jgi:hypothetical protein
VLRNVFCGLPGGLATGHTLPHSLPHPVREVGPDVFHPECQTWRAIETPCRSLMAQSS